MRIEILVGNSEEPLIYPLNKPKITIGSSETCDVIIHAENVSRKHLTIVTEGDAFYVVDQGSTNGSYVNEERLVPGRRVEFTSFFPVRLGDSVLVTLLSDSDTSGLEEAEISESSLNEPSQTKVRSSEESTSMISLRDLQKAKTSNLVSKRQEVIKKRASTATRAESQKGKVKPPSRREKEKKRMNLIKLMVLLILGGAAYVNLFVFEKAPEEVEIAKVGEVIETPKKEVVPPPSKLVAPTDLPEFSRVENLISDIKCTLDIEKYLCDRFTSGSNGHFGAIQVGTMLYVLIDGSPFIDEARKVLRLLPKPSGAGEHTPEELALYELNIKKLSGLIFFLRSIPSDLDYELLKDYRLTFGFFVKNAEGVEHLHEAVVVLPDSIKEIKRVFEESHLKIISRIGPSAFEFTKELFTIVEQPKESSETQPAPSSLPE